MRQELKRGFLMMVVMTVLTGLVYPGIVTALSQALFPDQANGSLVTVDGHVIGSGLIGQSFTQPEYFHPRPSAAGNGYDPMASGGSNLGPTSAKLIDRVKASVEQYRRENPGWTDAIPADAVTASASGLDPHISPANADIQATRVAKARGVQVDRVRALIADNTNGRTFGILGDPHVNVLELNLALDRRFRKSPAAR